MIIYLIRHGETTGDIEDRYGGTYDDHLTDKGRQQSVTVAALLANQGIQKLYSSPLIRAQETAKIIANETGLTVETLEDFKERNSYGILSGMTKTKAMELHPELVTKLDDVHLAITGAEAYADFQQRITAAIDSLIAQPYDTVAVVTHGGPIKLVFRDILVKGEVKVADCAFVTLEMGQHGCRVLKSNGVAT